MVGFCVTICLYLENTERDMSFVPIDNMTDSEIKLDGWIKDVRNHSKDKKITPEFAMEVLRKTNHSGNLRVILINIGDKCKSVKERLEYKEFVLSAIEGREHKSEIREYLYELAKEGGYIDEFKKADKKPKVYGSKDCYALNFVKIDKDPPSIFEMDGRVKRLKGRVTPDSAMEILKQTNHYVHIKNLIKFVEDSQGGLEYKEFMLSCVCGRVTSQSAYEMIEKWCEKHNCMLELERTNAFPKVYDIHGNVIVKKAEDENERDVTIRELKSMSATQLFK